MIGGEARTGKSAAPDDAQVSAVASVLRQLFATAGIYGGYLSDSWFATAARGLLDVARLFGSAPTAATPSAISTDRELAERFPLADLEAIVDALESDTATIARVVARSGREFLPAQAELVERLQGLRDTFRWAADRARAVAAAEETVVLVEGSPGSGRFT